MVLYLDYNTGRRISRNGRTLSKLLQDLVDDNPNISQIDLVGHSMGGLVARSALFYAKQDRLDWMKRVVTLYGLAASRRCHLSALGFWCKILSPKFPSQARLRT